MLDQKKSPYDFPICFHIGTGRAGSTFLYRLLEGHENVSLPRGQEIGFFTDWFEKGLPWYVNHFQSENKGVKIDTSPAYFSAGNICAKRIEQTYGSTSDSLKMLIILRHPVDYLFSHYYLMKGYGKIPSDSSGKALSFEDYINLNPDFLQRGRYAENLEKNWFSLFPKECFQIIFFEEFIKDKEKVFNQILDFWGLNQNYTILESPFKNKTMRHPLLYKLQAWAVKSEFLKTVLRNSKTFQFIYNSFFTIKPALKTETRQKIWRELESDIYQLEEILSRKTPWAESRL